MVETSGFREKKDGCKEWTRNQALELVRSYSTEVRRCPQNQTSLTQSLGPWRARASLVALPRLEGGERKTSQAIAALGVQCGQTDSRKRRFTKGLWSKLGLTGPPSDRDCDAQRTERPYFGQASVSIHRCFRNHPSDKTIA